MCENESIITDLSKDIQKTFAKVAIQVNLAFRQFMQQKFKQYQFDLTYEMVQIMGYLWEHDGVNQQEIANATLKDKASLTYLIDNLTSRDLVFRREDSVDRRNKLIFLTPKGQQLRHDIKPLIDEMYNCASMGIPKQEFEKALKLLQKVCVNLKDAHSQLNR